MRLARACAAYHTTCSYRWADHTLCVAAWFRIWFQFECRRFEIVFVGHFCLVCGVSKFGSWYLVAYVLCSAVGDHRFEFEFEFASDILGHHHVPFSADDLACVQKPR